MFILVFIHHVYYFVFNNPSKYGNLIPCQYKRISYPVFFSITNFILGKWDASKKGLKRWWIETRLAHVHASVKFRKAINYNPTITHKNTQTL